MRWKIIKSIRILHCVELLTVTHYMGELSGWLISMTMKYMRRRSHIIIGFRQQNVLLHKLLGRTNISLSGGKALIGYDLGNGTYRGVLCTNKNFDPNGRIISETLQLFEIDNRDFFRVDDKIFYSKLALETPLKIIHLRDLTQIIRDKIMSRATWSKFKGYVVKKDLRAFKEFLNTFTTDDIYDEIAQEYCCSVEEVRPHIDNFIRDVQKYLTPDVFDDELFSAVVQNCPALIDKYQTMVEEQWNADNSARMSEANAQLEQIKNEITELTRRRTALEQEIEFLQASRDDFIAQPLQTPSTKKSYRPGQILEPNVDNKSLTDFIYDFEGWSARTRHRQCIIRCLDRTHISPSSSASTTNSSSHSTRSRRFFETQQIDRRRQNPVEGGHASIHCGARTWRTHHQCRRRRIDHAL